VRTKLEQVIIGALGTTKWGLDQNLQLIPGHAWAIELDHTNEHRTPFLKHWGKSL